MTNSNAIELIKKEVPDFDIYLLQEREIVIAAFKMGWECKTRYDLQSIISVTDNAPAISPKGLAAIKSGAQSRGSQCQDR